MAESAAIGSPLGPNPLVRHLDFQLETNSSADKLYDIFLSECELYPRLMPEVIKNVETMTADEWLWTFVDGKCGTWKNSVEGKKETKSVTWTLLEGEVPEKLYKSLKVDYLFSPAGKGCKVKVKLTYEMNDINVLPPDSYKEFIRNLLVAAANTPLQH